MSRTVNERRPEELLDAIHEYLLWHGLSDLALRPLAKAVGSSPRVLLYYFGSKEKMIVSLLARIRERQRAIFGQVRAETFFDACRGIWTQMAAAESERNFRLFFEVYGLALRHPDLYREFLDSTIEDWLETVAGPLHKEGWKPEKARGVATILLAGFRGFMLDYCTTRDRKRLDLAVSLWLRSLDSISHQ
jgi:AcrR family transcriptional regulator